MLGAPDWALDEEMVTMRPQPSAIMSGTASCMQVKVPVRLTASMRSHFSGVMSATASKDSMPALVTRIVIGPSSLAHRGEHLLQRSAVGHVDLVGSGAWTLGRRARPRPSPPRTVAIEQGHGMAVCRQPVGDAEADARRGPGDHRHPGAHCGASAGVNSMCSSWRPRRTQVGS